MPPLLFPNRCLHFHRLVTFAILLHACCLQERSDRICSPRVLQLCLAGFVVLGSSKSTRLFLLSFQLRRSSLPPRVNAESSSCTTFSCSFSYHPEVAMRMLTSSA